MSAPKNDVSDKQGIDTDTPTGKFMLTVFAALSQLEREQLKQRQREGIEIAKAQGKYTGRKPIPTDWTRFGQLYEKWRAKNITGRDFMRRMDMSANTFYRRVREYVCVSMKSATASPSRPLLDLATSDERKCPTSLYEPAECKKLPSKKASPLKSLRELALVISYLL